MVFKQLFHNLGSAVTILFVCRTALPICVYMISIYAWKEKITAMLQVNHCNIETGEMVHQGLCMKVFPNTLFKKENTNLYQNSRNYRHYKQHFINPYKSWSLWFKRTRQFFFILIYRALFQGNFHQNKMTCNKWSPTLVPVYTCTL